MILRWATVGAGKLALEHRPGLSKIPSLAPQGCQRVVTLLSEKEGARRVGQAVQQAGMAWTWLPVPNGQYPRGETHRLLLEGLLQLVEWLDAGEAILIHCSAGIHRTGMLAYALLCWRGLSAEEALELIGALRDHTRAGLQARQIAWGNDLNHRRSRSEGMKIEILPNKDALGAAAAAQAAAGLRLALAERGQARLILATGASQFEMLSHLVRQPAIEWGRVTCFHLDEYIGLPETHPASFRKYLKERFVAKLPRLADFHFIQGEGSDPLAECRRVGALIRQAPVDVACVGIGENGHLAFNDPPADFEAEEPYLIVQLDEACRRQQLGEGWFPSLEDVPTWAISMSIRQIMKSRRIVCTVPDERKARAVKECLRGPVTPRWPASILQQHADCTVLLDPPAAGLL